MAVIFKVYFNCSKFWLLVATRLKLLARLWLYKLFHWWNYNVDVYGACMIQARLVIVNDLSQVSHSLLCWQKSFIAMTKEVAFWRLSLGEVEFQLFIWLFLEMWSQSMHFSILPLILWDQKTLSRSRQR